MHDFREWLSSQITFFSESTEKKKNFRSFLFFGELKDLKILNKKFNFKIRLLNV